MPSKRKLMSVRLPHGLETALIDHANTLGITPHAAVIAAIQHAIGATPARPDPKAILAEAEAKAAHLGSPRARWRLKR